MGAVSCYDSKLAEIHGCGLLHSGCRKNVCYKDGELRDSLFTDDEDALIFIEPVELLEPIERRMMNFRAFDAIPDGWFQIDEPPPDGFLFLGGDACVIQAGARTEELKSISIASLAPESGPNVTP